MPKREIAKTQGVSLEVKQVDMLKDGEKDRFEGMLLVGNVEALGRPV